MSLTKDELLAYVRNRQRPGHRAAVLKKYQSMALSPAMLERGKKAKEVADKLRDNVLVRAAVKKTFETGEEDMPMNRLDELHFDLTKTRQRERLVRGSSDAQDAYKRRYKVARVGQAATRLAAHTGVGLAVGGTVGGPIGATIGGGLGLASGLHSIKYPSMHLMKLRHKYALKKGLRDVKKSERLQRWGERRMEKFRRQGERQQAIQNYKREFREGLYEAPIVTGPAAAAISALERSVAKKGAASAVQKVGRLAAAKNKFLASKFGQSKYVQSSLPRLKKTGEFFGDVRHMPKTARDLVFAPKGPKGFRSGLAKRLGRQALAGEVMLTGGVMAHHKIKKMADQHYAHKAYQQQAESDELFNAIVPGLDLQELAMRRDLINEAWGAAIGGAVKSAGSWLGRSTGVFTGAANVVRSGGIKDVMRARGMAKINHPIAGRVRQIGLNKMAPGLAQIKGGLAPAATIAGAAGAYKLGQRSGRRSQQNY